MVLKVLGGGQAFVDTTVSVLRTPGYRHKGSDSFRQKADGRGWERLRKRR